MALTAKSAYKFYKEGGGGSDQADASLLAEAKQFAAIDRDRGNKTILRDKELGTIMVNVQHMQDDQDNTRTFVQDEDEMLNVIKGTFPSGCIYISGASRWGIPWTRTEWMGTCIDHKGGGVYWGYNKAAKGARDVAGNLMWVEKIIPVGFQVYRVITFGTNTGGVGNESKFRTFASTFTTNTNTGAGASSNAKVILGSPQSMDSTVLSSGALTGNGLNTMRVEVEFGDKNDVVYGGVIELTQV